MRAACLGALTALTLLSACNREPSFDEQYQAQSGNIAASANSIERQLANQMSGAQGAAHADVDAMHAPPAPDGGGIH